MQNVFGSGVLWGTPLQDAAGASISNPTPVQFGVLQDVGVDVSFDVKKLHGQNQFPVAIGRGKGNISLKAKFAKVNGMLLNSLLFGLTLSSGMTQAHYDVTGSVIPTTPFQVTVAPPSSGTWSRDLGVRSSAGVPLTRVAAGPTTGQYSVAAGVYTFAAADVGLTVFIDYIYTSNLAGSKQSTVTNQPMGSLPTFRCDLQNIYKGKVLTLSFLQCSAAKFGLATKQDDFAIPEVDIEAFADDNGQVFTYSLFEQ